MNTAAIQRRCNLIRLHVIAAFWRVARAIEPDGSEAMGVVLRKLDRAEGNLRRAQLKEQERAMNARREQ